MMQFSKLRLLHPEMERVRSGLLGVMDLGSSAMNLSIFDVDHSGPNHFVLVDKIKVDTQAGKVRPKEGLFYLNDELICTLNDACDQLAEMLAKYQPDYVVATATSVFRDASNGPEWCASLNSTRGWVVNLIDGATEAKLSGIGALSNIDVVQGVVVDQGGGSLELYNIATEQCASFPLGVLSLMNQAEGVALKAADIISEALCQDVPWLNETQGDLVLVGRAMRTMGKLVLAEGTQSKSLSRLTMLELATDIITGRINQTLIMHYPGYETKLPFRAAVVKALLNSSGLERVRFADYALREGVFLTQTGMEKR